jgi:hypothetical protein
MSPQPGQDGNRPHDEFEDLFRRGAILRREARQARAMARELREVRHVRSTERRSLDGTERERPDDPAGRRAEVPAASAEWLR